MIYQVVSSLGYVVFETSSLEDAELYCKEHGLSSSAIWPIRPYTVF